MELLDILPMKSNWRASFFEQLVIIGQSARYRVKKSPDKDA
jgi:hypothetical protein